MSQVGGNIMVLGAKGNHNKGGKYGQRKQTSLERENTDTQQFGDLSSMLALQILMELH